MKTTEENNRMIAEFMGLTQSTISNKYWTQKNAEGITSGELVELKYHTSWDWLMPVVEKIESIIFDDDTSFNVTIGSTNYCVIQDSIGEVYESIEDYGNSKLETVYKTVVQFIEWYNSQNFCHENN